MAPWCIHISCLERVARSGSGRDSVRGLVGAMDAELSRPDWLATVQSGRKQVQSRVCTPSFNCTNRPVSAPAAKKSATNIGEITFGGPIFNVLRLNYLGKRHKKTFTKSLGGGHGPCGPLLATPLSLAMRKGFR